MTLDPEGSEYALAYLKMALDLCRCPLHLKEFVDKNQQVISRLTDEDKETLRAVYRDTQDRLRKAA